MLNWSQDQLATAANVARATIADFERGTRSPVANNLSAIRAALEAAGVELVAENGGGAGVRLRKGISVAASASEKPVTASPGRKTSPTSTPRRAAGKPPARKPRR